MGEYRELRKHLDELEARLRNDLIPPIREMQAQIKVMNDECSKRLMEALQVAGQIRVASERFITRAADEIDAEGGGVIGRRRRSTNLEQSDEDVKTVVKKVAEMEKPIKEKGKRYCGNCGRGGHRRTTCPN